MLQATSPGNSNTASATTQAGTAVPTATLSANPTSITSGQSSTLTWSSTNATSCTGTGFTAGGTSGSASVSPTVTMTYSVTCTGAGGTSPAASATVTVTGGGTITIGETTIVPTADSNNGNLLLAQNASLSQTATIQSLSFYVTTAGGNLRLGIYDATGPGGGPGALKAQTNSFTPAANSWNTANVVTPVSLPAGTYWLAYLPSSNTLAFRKTTAAGISGKLYSYTFGALPATYSTAPNSTPSHWSLYATLSTAPAAKFAINDRVQVTCSGGGLNVRATPSTSGTLLATQPDGTLGTVIGGPTAANGFNWWNINYDTGADGWSVEDYLVKVTADTTAPSTPTGLTATAISSSQINLSWTASTDNVGVTGYQIYRGGAQLERVHRHIYSNTGLTASTAYSYYVSAYDAAGNFSGNSNTANATTQAGTPVPTATLAANPTSITSGQSSTLTWSSTNATCCTGTGFTASGTSGSTNVSPTVTTTYSITCTGAGGTSPAASATVTVTAGTPDIIVSSITASPANPTAGQAVTFSAVVRNQGTAATPAGTILGILFSVDGTSVSWSDTNTASLAAGASVTLTANGGPSGATWSATAGTHTILANADDVNRITESNESNNTLSTSLTVTASPPPTATLSANPTSVAYNGSATLTWNSTNATSCTASGGWSGAKATSGTQTLTSLTSTATYTITCTGAGGTSPAASATVTVGPPPDTTPPSTPANLSASVISSSQINLSWTASTDNVGVTGYKIFRDGVQVGTSATNSFSNTGLAASTVYSYTVSAYDAAGNNSAQSSATGAITQSAGAASIAVGGRVVTTANLNVRQSASAGATKLGTESSALSAPSPEAPLLQEATHGGRSTTTTPSPAGASAPISFPLRPTPHLPSA